MKTTDYFRDQVKRKRKYLRQEWIEKALKDPVHHERQPLPTEALSSGDRRIVAELRVARRGPA